MPDDNKAPLQTSDDDLLKQVHDLTQQITELQSRPSGMTADDRAKIQQLTDVVCKVNDQLSERVASRRTGEFDTNPETRAGGGPVPARNKMDRLHRELPSKSNPQAEEIREFQEQADNLYLISKLTGKKITELDAYRDFRELEIVRKADEAIDEQTIGSVGGGDGWYPVQFSAQIHELVRLQRRVAALHPRINMPTDPYKLPIEGPDAQMFMVNENVTAADYVTSTSLIKHADSLSANALTNLSLSTKKIGARLVVSAEADEASIVAMLPYFRGKLVRGMGDAEEDATLNGDDNVGTASALDNDMTPSTQANHPRKAWNGYRRLVEDITNTPTKIAVQAAQTLDVVTDIRNLKVEFGKYGVNPSDLTFVTGPVGLNKLLSLRDGSNPSPVLTLEKYGPQATILTGEIARVDGVPLIVSEHVREDTNASGVYDGTTTDRTMLFLVNRAAFVYGDFRRMSLNSRYVPDTDQNVMVVLQRLTFGSWFPADPTVGYLYNIQK